MAPRTSILQKPENEWPDFKRSTNTANSKPDPEKKNKPKIKSNTSEINTEGMNNANITEDTQDEERFVTGQVNVIGNIEDTHEVLFRILAGSSTYRKARGVTTLAVRAIKVAPYSLIQFTNDLYRSVRLDVILATFAWNFRSSAKFLKQEPQNLCLSAVMYQNMIILHYFLDFLKS